jgi:hypothetical protein
MAAKTEQHTLTIVSKNDSTVTRRYDAKCSCKKLTIRNEFKDVIREAHAEHLQRYLGPDASRENENVR